MGQGLWAGKRLLHQQKLLGVEGMMSLVADKNTCVQGGTQDRYTSQAN